MNEIKDSIQFENENNSYSTQNIEKILQNPIAHQEILNAGKRRADDMWRQSAEIILRNVDSKNKILDVGIGLGQTTTVFIDGLKHNYNGVFSLDLAPLNQMEQLKKGYSVAKGESLPYATDSFDTVFFIDYLHHTVDPKVSLNEAKRVVKNNGTIIILENLLRNDLSKSEQGIYQKILFAFDNSLNAQNESTNPHSNQTFEGWQQIANEQGMKLIDYKKWQWGPFDIIPGIQKIGNRENPGLIRPFTDVVMVFQNQK